MTSLKQEYLSSFARIKNISVAALFVMALSTGLMYFKSRNISQNLLPIAFTIDELNQSVSESLEELNSWVHFLEPAHKDIRQQIWRTKIEVKLNELKSYFKAEQNLQLIAQINELEDNLHKLYTSQWWVEDVNQYIGNQPALVLYQKDLMPVYYRLQSAISGLDTLADNSESSNSIKLSVTTTHLQLTETIHQLSEVVLTGEGVHMKRFNQGVAQVSKSLDNLRIEAELVEDGEKLLTWVSQQYKLYVGLAEQVINLSQASDANLAIHTMATETDQLSSDIKKQLYQLRSSHVQLLGDNSSLIDIITLFTFLLSLSFLFFCTFAVTKLFRRRLNLMLAQIEQLKTGAHNLTSGKQNAIDILNENELGELAKVFNTMQHMIKIRNNKIEKERERLSEIIHVITHDLKTPVISINGHVKLINNVLDKHDKTEKPSEDQQLISSGVEHIELAANRMGELIRGILSFSTTMHNDVSFQDVNLAALVNELLEINSIRLQNTKIDLKHLPECAFSDQFSIKYIVSTFLDNAIHHKHSERSLMIEVGFIQKVGEQGWSIYVKDNGIGISKSCENNVFRMFAKSSKDSEGHGIGLACAKSLAERINGEIAFENNTSGTGVTFFYTQHCEKDSFT